MLECLTPDLALPSVLALTPAVLRCLGATAVIFDLDNTLVAYGSAEPADAVRAYLAGLGAEGIPAVLLSNATAGRARELAAKLGLPHVGSANKPAVGGFRRALAVLGRPAAETAVVGDQLFRDVLGARRAGCIAVWVEPMTDRDFPGTRLLRPPERFVIGWLRSRGRWVTEL